MHLLVALSPHGFGHAAQASVVLNALRRRQPDLRVTVQTSLPRAFLAGRIDGGFDYVPRATDFGLLMHSALHIDMEASAARYRQQHRDWEHRVSAEAAAMEALAPDLLLADVPYLSLAAAGRAGVPAVALCSLNWAGVYRQLFGHRPEAPAILDQMEAAYNAARLFLCPEPSMPMPELSNVRAIGPLARVGRDCRDAIRSRLELSHGQRLVLLAPGGVPTRSPMERWPVTEDVHWLVPAAWESRRPDTTDLESLQMDFIDVLRSVDALVGKCGYGTVAECVCNGTPMVYAARPDWPEEPYLADWLTRHGRCAPLERDALEEGRVGPALARCWEQPSPAPVAPTGVDEAARLILAQRERSGRA